MTEKSKYPATILAVDDTNANLTLLANLLKEYGHRVRLAPSGKLALNAVQTSPPDLILLDINMPEMDGYEVCERLKADERWRDIPVIFLSALSETMDKVKAFNLGGVDYINKPFQVEELTARVDTHLNLRRLQIELQKHNHHLEDLVKEKIAEISESQLSTIFALAKLAEARDDTTGQHIERTRTFCMVLARKMQSVPRYASIINHVFVENIFHASPLHDIGKVGISDSVLLKPGKLDAAEFEKMKTHTLIGSNTLTMAKGKYPRNAFLNMGIEIARSHHEKWDGTGYPDGLTGENIPLSARVMAVADVYDALRSVRPYKPTMSHEKACEIIIQGSGSHFDPSVIEAFKALESEFAEIRVKMDDAVVENAKTA